MLSLSELMGVWIEELLAKRKKTQENYSRLLADGDPVEDPIYDVLKERQRRFSRVRKVLLDKNKTKFIFVLNPERLPIIETKAAIQLLEKYDLHVDTLVINKVLSGEIDGQFFKQRREYEKQYINQIDKAFSNMQLIYVPFFPHDIISKDQLITFSNHF